MNHRYCRALLSSFILTLLCSGLAPAQSKQPPVKSSEENTELTRLTVGIASGTAGESIVVPVYLNTPKGVEVERFNLDVTYVSVNMKFATFDAGVGPGMERIEFHSQVKEAKNDKGVDTQTIRITASAADAAQKGIPSGLVAYLTMKISEKARSASISLRAAGQAKELGTDKEMQSVKVVDGSVGIVTAGAADPLTTCFFFTH